MSPATELMNTKAPSPARCGSASRATRKWPRRLTAKVMSQSSAVVPAMRAPRPMPTLSTTPWSGSARALDDGGAVALVRHVAHDHRGLRSLGLHESRGRLRGTTVAVGAHHLGTFAGGQHRDGPTVADGRVRVVGGLGARPHHEHSPAGQSRLGHGRRR